MTKERKANKLLKKWQAMIFLSALPFFILLFPFLLGKLVFLTGDPVNYLYPDYVFYKEALTGNGSFFWNPNIFSGFASFLSSSGFLSPLHYILFRFLPLFTAYNLIIFLSAVFSVYFTWKLLLKFKLSYWVGFFGGLVYAFSQWSRMTDISLSAAFPVLPLLFLIIWHFKEKKNNLIILWGGLLVGWSWLAMNFNWLVMILSAGFVFSLFLGWLEPKRKWLIPFKFFLISAIGLIPALLVLLPLLDYSALSNRSLGLNYYQAIGGALHLGDFVRFILPYFKISFLSLARSPAQLYLGILPLFFLIFSLRFRSLLVRFFSFLFFVCLLLSVKYSPLFWLLQKLPVFSSLRGPFRWMFIGSFAGAVLASFGLEGFLKTMPASPTAKPLRTGQKKASLKIFKYFTLAFTSLLAVLTLVFYFFKDKFILLAKDYFDNHLYAKTSGLPIEHYHNFIESVFSELEKAVNLLNYEVFIPIFFLILSFLILYYFSKSRHFLFLVILTLCLNFIFVFAFFHPFTSKAEFYNQPETIQLIKNRIEGLGDIQSKRVFSFMPGFSEYSKLTIPFNPTPSESFIFQKSILVPNINQIFGIESADYYNNLMSRRMGRILALIGSDRAIFGDKLADLDIPIEEKIEKFEKQKKILNFLGIRYIISVFPLNTRTFPLIHAFKIPPYQIPVYIYENPGARPLLYFADSVEVIEENEEAAYNKLLGDSFEGRKIFIECNDCEEIQTGGKGKIILKEKKNDSVLAETESSENQVLVFSQNYLPGWKAYLDNQEIAIYTANSVYMSIFIPQGRHEILFKYNPYSF